MNKNISLQLIKDRDEYGPVHVTDETIFVFSYSWQLIVRKGCLQYISIPDFKKMLKAVKSQLGAYDYYKYLEAWSAAIASRRYALHSDCDANNRVLTKNERIILGRLSKFDEHIEKQILSLPEWACAE